MTATNKALRRKSTALQAPCITLDGAGKSVSSIPARMPKPLALIALFVVPLLFGTSIVHAQWIYNSPTKNIADGQWPSDEPRPDVQDNTLGCDLAYITRYQPKADMANDVWRVQTLYNTRYQTGFGDSSSERYGGHLRILTKDNTVIDLTDELLGVNDHRDVSDLALSYEADKIVFSARNSVEDCWRLDEIALNTANYATSAIRNLTPDVDYDCIDPCYRPDGHIIFTANRRGTLNEYEMQLNELLHVMDPNAEDPSSTIRQISFFQSGDYNPVIMNDGRLLWMRYEHHGI